VVRRRAAAGRAQVLAQSSPRTTTPPRRCRRARPPEAADPPRRWPARQGQRRRRARTCLVRAVPRGDRWRRGWLRHAARRIGRDRSSRLPLRDPSSACSRPGPAAAAPRPGPAETRRHNDGGKKHECGAHAAHRRRLAGCQPLSGTAADTGMLSPIKDCRCRRPATGPADGCQSSRATSSAFDLPVSASGIQTRGIAVLSQGITPGSLRAGVRSRATRRDACRSQKETAAPGCKEPPSISYIPAFTGRTDT
jgi:hypothetical protein